MMSRDTSSRPLIDLIHDNNLGVSDEEDAFYAHDDGDYLLTPKWRGMNTNPSTRIPRRLQRYFVIYVIAAVVILISWWVYIGPRYAVYRQEQLELGNAAKMGHVKSMTPAFKDLIQVQDLDEKHLPRGDRRLVVVGDVHGCKEELEELLKKVGFRDDKDHLILTGDIVAKGPDSPGVVTLASRIGASCVRGNHEDKILLSIEEINDDHKNSVARAEVDVVDRPSENQEPAVLGTEPELLQLAKSFTEQQLSYLKSCPVILRVGQVGALHNVVVVHAGLVPDVPLEQQDPFQVMNMRTIDLDTLVPSEKRKHTPWEKYWNHQQKRKPAVERTTVIYGHDRKRGKNINKYSMGLDSGCVSGGHLTAMVIKEGGKHKYVQVKCKQYGAYVPQ
ncbi:Metallo-dependent phosphatase [Bimuria novae-zelandiae CBS 107.79]|uniref:Metallo-dependent phosphatase n=1 Tax=Bimuria novae-zelandiae CBS 107.79 TaxID=1447943 RepID=A0A6A5V628_9PLEO|nr:Metallo-dependent phosphatase [Bimuria novae-zelandiae CBS 107.79]